MKITIPELSLVTLIGSSGSGKTTFASTHFQTTEVISSDFCRGLISNDENNQLINKKAFDLLYYIVSKRLELGNLTVIDATNVQEESRKPIINLAREFHFIPVAIVLNLPEKVCQERNLLRKDHQVSEHVIKKHSILLRKSIKKLKKEGFRHIFILNTIEEISEVLIERKPLWNNLKHDHGPFDIIGDVHGCFNELVKLLEKLEYKIEKDITDFYQVSHPHGRKVIFLGDLVDRGPNVVEVLKLAMSMVKSSIALCVPGNHEIKLLRKLKGNKIQHSHGLDKTLEQLDEEPIEFVNDVRLFLDNLISHYVLDDGKLVVAHAGMKEEYQGRGSAKIRDFALYGETTGETDEYGLPVRYDWASNYRGKAIVLFGHTPQADVLKVNNTYNIDTGCVFGGKLTAFRYPERVIEEVKAYKVYYEPKKPLLNIKQKLFEERQEHDCLDIKDVIGKRVIETKLYKNITIHEENSIAAFEVMSRFSADPHWLIYLPPTMSPSETSNEEGILEYPTEAFSYYRNEGVKQVVCEQKHMGSRAIIIVCSSEEVARKRFEVVNGEIGICYTRTGRHFFDDSILEKNLINRIKSTLNQSNFWNDFETDWVCLDVEVMPWSLKAQALLKDQYSTVGITGKVALKEAINILNQGISNLYNNVNVSRETSGQNVDIESLLKEYSQRSELLDKYTNAYRRYCWQVNSIDDLKIAPFHILASEGKVYSEKNHLWHMENIKKYLTNIDKIIIETNYIIVDVNDKDSVKKGIEWWENLTNLGGEGMVVKPFDFIARNNNKLLQPAVKCRGKEYLRIIYGPEYTLEDNLRRIKIRSVTKKRSLALREFSLGIEALERFVRNEPLYRVHECVFGVLSLESEPVDPRL